MGFPTRRVDGNNVLDVFAATALAREEALATERPVFLLADTFRMGGHATHDEDEGRRLLPARLFEHYGRRDPVRTYRAFLARGGAGGEPVAEAELSEIESRVEAEVEDAVRAALESQRNARPDPADAGEGVFGAAPAP